MIAALVLVLPSISNELVLDDHVLRMLAVGDPPIEGLRHGRTGLFTFTTGEEPLNRALMDEGALLPWWSDPHHLNSFLRPLSSASHSLDFALLGDAVWAMHVHSFIWFALMLAACARLYRRVYGGEGGGAPTIITLAFCIFALDDAHGVTLSWLANRNAIIAAALAIPAIEAHVRWRDEGRATLAVLAVSLFCAALMAGEAAIGALGYVLAHALFLDRAPLMKRFVALVPYGALLVVWQLAYRELGLGSAGSGAYHDPIGEPLGFALALARNLPILVAAQLGPPIADPAFWGYPPLVGALWACALLTIGVLLWATRGVLSDPRARFWAVGMCLAAVPVSASLPGERLLIMIGIGGSALVAAALQPLLDGTATGLRRSVLWLLAFAHLAVAPLSLPLRAHALPILGRVLDRADASLPAVVPDGERWFILNAPFDMEAGYIQVARASRGTPRPLSLNWLSTASSEITVLRDSASTLTIAPARGFISSPPEQHYRGDWSALTRGSEVHLAGTRVEILSSTEDGRPASARFHFEHPLEHTGYRFFYWREGVYRPWEIPEVGATRRFDAQDFFEVVLTQ